MNKWIAEFELEDGDIMPEHMNLEYRGARIDFHCKPLEQESKPMVEIDLYSVIKQKYIERDVLDKIRAEIDKARFIDKDTRICKNALASGLEVAMQIIDEYKGESEK